MLCQPLSAYGVRFRTEKSLFSRAFVAKVILRGAAIQTLPTRNNKGMSGHVR